MSHYYVYSPKCTWAGILEVNKSITPRNYITECCKSAIILFKQSARSNVLDSPSPSTWFYQKGNRLKKTRFNVIGNVIFWTNFEKLILSSERDNECITLDLFIP